MDPKITLGNTEDFQSFIKFCKKWDRITMQRYWTMAERKKHLILLRKAGPGTSQVMILSPDDLPNVAVVIKKRLYGLGWVGIPTEPNHFYIFGSEVKKEVVSRETEKVPEKKKRGRPRKTEQIHASQ